MRTRGTSSGLENGMAPHLDVTREMIFKIRVTFGAGTYLNKHTNVFEAKTLNDAMARHTAELSRDFGFSLEADAKIHEE